MSDALKQLNNIRTLRTQAREIPLYYLEELLGKVKVVVEERRNEEMYALQMKVIVLEK